MGRQLLEASGLVSTKDAQRPTMRLPESPAVIFASGDQEIQEELIPVLKRCGLQPLVISSLRELQMTLQREEIALAFCTNKLPDGSFRDALHMFKVSWARVPVVIASRLGNWDEYLEAMRLGAFDYVSTPYRFPDVERAVSNALREHAIHFDGHDEVRHEAEVALGRHR